MKKIYSFLILIVSLILILGIDFFVKSNKETHTDKDIVYTTTLTTKYISAADTTWPPQRITAEGIFSCDQNGNEILPGGQTILKEIDGHEYCITTSSEGAAGSTYTTYTYKKTEDGLVSETTFTLRFVQCANYDDPQKTECELERNTFNVDTLGVAILNI